MMGKNEPQAAPKVEKTWPMDIAPQGVSYNVRLTLSLHYLATSSFGVQ